MVIGVVEKLRIHHLLNRSLATRAGIPLPIGKFELAVAANDLVFFLGGHHPVTVTAADEAGEGEFVL